MRILIIDEVVAKTRLAKRTIQAMASRGAFPKPVPLGARRRGWIEDEVETWLAARASERGQIEAAHYEQTEQRRRYWDDIRAGRRPHPRTLGKQRRLEAEAVARAQPQASAP